MNNAEDAEARDQERARMWEKEHAIEAERRAAVVKERERCIGIVRDYSEVVPAARAFCNRIIEFMKR